MASPAGLLRLGIGLRDELVLTNAEGDVIAGRRLAADEDAAEVARSLLREMTEVKDAFNRVLPYPKLHLA